MSTRPRRAAAGRRELALSLSALGPIGTEERRRVDGVLARRKGI